ncbi:glutaredoxin domain-containing protein [Marinomonas sp. MED121]|uniref:glutaredoxin family protein n=1 Tax=Marinomonas sp. MED121 TaxID=314277 RepID=UPI00031F037B|nr:glutaredoxin domain-containing protein [Marinomonas sp. MED121]
MLVKLLRNGLGQLIIFIDFITRPAKMKRSAEAQVEVVKEAEKLALYQFNACPFCVKTRRTMHKLNVPIKLKDAKNNDQDRQLLLEHGGKIQVPCLHIQSEGKDEWLYESKAINAYLTDRFAA